MARVDEPRSRRHNGDVFRPVARIASGLIIAPFLLFGSALTPLHVHEPAAGHSHPVVHSHFEPHHFDSHEAEGAEFEQAAERVIWLENAVFHQTAYHANSGLPLLVASFDVPPDVPSWSATPFDEVAPVHGPPRSDLSFRGPPLSLA